MNFGPTTVVQFATEAEIQFIESVFLRTDIAQSFNAQQQSQGQQNLGIFNITGTGLTGQVLTGVTGSAPVWTGAPSVTTSVTSPFFNATNAASGFGFQLSGTTVLNTSTNYTVISPPNPGSGALYLCGNSNDPQNYFRGNIQVQTTGGVASGIQLLTTGTVVCGSAGHMGISCNGDSTNGIEVSNSNAFTLLLADAGNGAYSSVVQAGDDAIIFAGTGGSGTGNLAIGAWGGTGGMRIGANGNTVLTGTFTSNGLITGTSFNATSGAGYELAGNSVLLPSGTYVNLRSTDANQNIFLGANGTDPEIIFRAGTSPGGAGGFAFQDQAAASVAQLGVGTTPTFIMGRPTGNQIEIVGEPSGSTPFIGTLGTDTNISLNFNAKGSGGYVFFGNNFGGQALFVVNGSATTSNVNFLSVNPALTGNGPAIIANGTDTNVNLVLQGKGNQGVFIAATGSNSGQLQFAGLTSGIITVQPQSAAGTYNFNLPTTAGNAGQHLASGGGGSTAMTWAPSATTSGFEFVIDGGGATLVAATYGYLEVPFNCTITQSTLLANQSGSVVVDIYKCTYAQFDAGVTHPVAADKITASAPPTISSATKAQDATLTGWTTTLNQGDILGFVVTGTPTSIQRVTLSLRVNRT